MRRTMAAVVFGLAIGGCASVKSTEVTPLSPKMREKKAVQIRVATEEPGAERAVQYFRSGLISELLKRNLFEAVTTTEAPGGAEIKLAVTLSGFRGVSPAARGLVGGAAGRAKLAAAVTLTDLKSSEDLGAFIIRGKTGAYADAGTSLDVIDSVSIGVAEYLKANRP